MATLQKDLMLIFGIYLNSKSKTLDVKRYSSIINQIVNSYSNVKHILLLGDFNGMQMQFINSVDRTLNIWSPISRIAHTKDKLVEGKLDALLSTAEITNSKQIPNLLSDHVMLIFSINLKSPKIVTKIASKKLTLRSSPNEAPPKRTKLKNQRSKELQTGKCLPSKKSAACTKHAVPTLKPK